VKFDQPNATQRRWREDVSALGSVLSEQSPVEIHHCAGRTAVHFKVRIGHWWILPLTKAEHDEIARQGHDRKVLEKILFVKLMDRYVTVYGTPLPFGPEVIEAIQEYRR